MTDCVRSGITAARCPARLLVVVVAIVAGLSATCRQILPDTVSPADSVPMPARGFYLGVLPTPAEGQSFDSAYALAAATCEFVPVWGRPTPFYDLARELQGDWGGTFVQKLVRGNGMFPLVQLSFFDTGLTLKTPPDLTGATLSDSSWRAAYRAAALAVVRACRPRYLSLGNEVNRWFEKYGDDGPNGFRHYVSLYSEIYGAVKELSPGIIVFCTFAREIVSEQREANLTVLSHFPAGQLDLLVLTSYPHAVAGCRRPESLPDDYYSRVLTFVPNKLLGFTEAGWPSLPEFGGEPGQAEFLRQLAGRLTRGQGVGLHMLGWPWLHDLNSGDQTGLIRRDGTEKEAYGVWKQLSGP